MLNDSLNWKIIYRDMLNDSYEIKKGQGLIQFRRELFRNMNHRRLKNDGNSRSW